MEKRAGRRRVKKIERDKQKKMDEEGGGKVGEEQKGFFLEGCLLVLLIYYSFCWKKRLRPLMTFVGIRGT